MMARGDKAVTGFYSSIDDWWKLQTYITLEKRYLKGFVKEGIDKKVALDMAADNAVRDVLRFHPNYGAGSKMMQAVRPHVPFVSFPLEATRVWKNAFLHRPHIAFMWANMAEAGSYAAAGSVGMSPSEFDNAKESLPWYVKGKKLLTLPWRDSENKLQFLDLSYIIPMADIGSEAQMAQNTFFGVPMPTLIDPTSNPIANIITAGATGKDPFGGRPIEPRALEAYTGVRATGAGERKFLGLAEHTMALFLPPAVPPGYVGINMLELLTGRKSGVTGEDLEQSAGRSIMANFFGLRTYEPTVQAQISNIRHEQRVAGDELTASWNRWEAAVANGDMGAAEEERGLIVQIRDDQYGDGIKYFNDSFSRHQPGSYGNVGRREISESLVSISGTFFGASEMAPVYIRWLNLQRRRRR